MSFTRLFLTPCAPSRSFHRLSLSQELLEEKNRKRKTRRRTQLSSTTDWNCKVILKRHGERERVLRCPPHFCGVCVCVCVCRSEQERKPLTGGWYIAKRLFTPDGFGARSPSSRYSCLLSYSHCTWCPLHPPSLYSAAPPFNSSAEPLLTLQLPALAVEFPPLLSQVRAHADGVGGRLEPVKVRGVKGQGLSYFVNL